jgi:hypothetical protein
MALNFVRGFRRIGWVATFPLAALIILILYEKTKEYSPTDYMAEETNWRQENAPGVPILKLVEMPGTNFRWSKCPIQASTYFSPEVPTDVAGKIVKDFAGKQEPPHGKYIVETDAGNNFVVDDMGNTIQWKFTVHKHVRILKLSGLIIGAFAGVALVIQGSISILAWVFKGFKE